MPSLCPPRVQVTPFDVVQLVKSARWVPHQCVCVCSCSSRCIFISYLVLLGFRQTLRLYVGGGGGTYTV